ncbi:sodium:solute symporter [Acidithiobacillus caldus]|uniref:monocarboxylate uptake permease MctP n=1 Tax=Acidithiobacillus caldus TaxID=33059 RepID=UPI001C06C577|nr:sodium:solute symporter [Acidithiobacillus caldus]MBU2790656.1 sodium:solute symporter [Acidithiobacillus caldus]MBU2819789.1 sodium:solute symporter [Acidithiobacillus caldus]MCY0872012.1 sodium:solute symporter [Acidithiobacillus caldus]
MHFWTIGVFLACFALVTWIGLRAARWQSGDLRELHEWGLGGRRFGRWITWFLIGGDLYTAYTFIAVPALVFGAGALGFFALPYTVLVYPLVFAILPRLWAVAHRHGFVTAADFVAGRYDSPLLAFAVAATGFIATMPYIALQLVGIQVVFAALGLSTGPGWLGEIPLLVAFAVLAVFTYLSGLRAPAMIAVVKDVLVYITIFALIVVLPMKLGGFAAIFAKVPVDHLLLPAAHGGQLGLQSFYVTLALGSAMALMFYPHATTAVLSARGTEVLRWNWVFLPAYSLVLGLVALLGFMAQAADLPKLPDLAPYFQSFGPQFAMPGLLLHFFPQWFAGLGLAAVAIGALVPASIMSIAAANLFTRNLYKAYLRPQCSPHEETQMAKWMSLVVKFGALLFILFLPLQFAIQLQLMGGILILQTLPAIAGGLYTRWFDPRALLVGWLVGMGWGIWALSLTGFQKSVYTLHLGNWSIPAYVGIYALLLNLGLAVLVTLGLRLAGRAHRRDATKMPDYLG